MDEQKINLWLESNAKYFDAAQIPILKEKLKNASDEQYLAVQTQSYIYPTVTTIISVLLGELGIDRFMVGDIEMGVLKLLTGGLCGVLWLIDIFTINKKVKNKNFAQVCMLL